MVGLTQKTGEIGPKQIRDASAANTSLPFYVHIRAYPEKAECFQGVTTIPWKQG